ncbi:MAG TPA: bile acid:sodium symporter [Polyangiales bacterium]|nr:bile acid:sodium symporter [Polyangiales bacterium]
MLSKTETSLIALLLVLLMFGMGATLTAQRFRELAKNPRAFLIGSASQFGWMPLLAFILAKLLKLPDIAAVGLVVMGTCPGGTTSNLFAHLARADVALSISMTAASKVLGIALMPLCLFIYARPFTGTEFPIPYGNIVSTLILLLLPVAVAMALRERFGERFAHVAERTGSLAGICVLLALITISVTRNAHLFATVPLTTYLAAALLGSAGMLLGSLVARWCGLPVAQRRTVSFETGIQNSPLCFAILLLAFPSANQLELLALPLLYALFVLIEASVITLLYRTLDARSQTSLELHATAPAER